jgi:hypothetical protein
MMEDNSSSRTNSAVNQQPRGDEGTHGKATVGGGGGGEGGSRIQSGEEDPSAAIDEAIDRHDRDSPMSHAVDPLAWDHGGGDGDDDTDLVLLDRSTDLPPPLSSSGSRFHQHGSSQRRRRPRNIVTAAAATSTITGEYLPPSSRSPSRDQPSLAQAAVNSTFGLLRQVGGLTLSTTSALVAPPLFVTKRLLLPQLRNLLVDLWDTNSPQRVKDWFRILHSSLYHVVQTLRHTSAGHALRRQWGRVGQDVVDLAATDLTRQWLIDSMGMLVKLAEALATDEATALFDQWAITIVRALEILANPRVQLLVHDGRHAIAALATLLADPVATSALAEVTAYLCYALEQEEPSSLHGLEQQKRRHVYQTSLNQRDTIDQHPTMTVEEAILSSLDPAVVPIMKNERIDGYGDFLRRRVGIESPLSSPEESSSQQLPLWDTASSIRHQVEHKQDNKATAAASDMDDWYETAKRNVDVQYLREMIEERAMARQSSKNPAPPMEDMVVTVNTNNNCTTSATKSAPRHRVDVETVVSDEDDDNVDMEQHHPTAMTDGDGPSPPAGAKSPVDGTDQKLRLAGEAPMDQFERIVNDILTERRRQNTLSSLAHHNTAVPADGAAVATSSSPPPPAAVLRRTMAKTAKPRQPKSGGQLLVLVGVMAILGIATLWFGCGCLGVYLYWQHYHHHQHHHQPQQRPPNAMAVPESSSSSSSSSSAVNAGHHDIVIRVVREVVHVDTNGKVLGRGLLPKSPQNAGGPTPEEYEKVAACVAEAYKA